MQDLGCKTTAVGQVLLSVTLPSPSGCDQLRRRIGALPCTVMLAVPALGVLPGCYQIVAGWMCPSVWRGAMSHQVLQLANIAMGALLSTQPLECCLRLVWFHCVFWGQRGSQLHPELCTCRFVSCSLLFLGISRCAQALGPPMPPPGGLWRRCVSCVPRPFESGPCYVGAPRGPRQCCVLRCLLPVAVSQGCA
jgi:hypothetical protein